MMKSVTEMDTDGYEISKDIIHDTKKDDAQFEWYYTCNMHITFSANSTYLC